MINTFDLKIQIFSWGKYFSIMSNFYFNFMCFSLIFIGLSNLEDNPIFPFTGLIQFYTIAILPFIDYNELKSLIIVIITFFIFFHCLPSFFYILVWDYHLFFFVSEAIFYRILLWSTQQVLSEIYFCFKVLFLQIDVLSLFLYYNAIYVYFSECFV